MLEFRQWLSGLGRWQDVLVLTHPVSPIKCLGYMRYGELDEMTDGAILLLPGIGKKRLQMIRTTIKMMKRVTKRRERQQRYENTARLTDEQFLAWQRKPISKSVN
ncbi:MAG TPA: hypothetical protein VMA55_20575 [Acidovorax sp.]|nr:hypothetical protein [Acidovorax sp.]